MIPNHSPHLCRCVSLLPAGHGVSLLPISLNLGWSSHLFLQKSTVAWHPCHRQAEVLQPATSSFSFLGSSHLVKKPGIILEDGLAVSRKAKHTLTVRVCNRTRWYLPKGVEHFHPPRNLHTVLFIIPKLGSKRSVSEWTDKLGDIQTTRYYSALKRNELSTLKRRGGGNVIAYYWAKGAHLKGLPTEWLQASAILEKTNLRRKVILLPCIQTATHPSSPFPPRRRKGNSKGGGKFSRQGEGARLLLEGRGSSGFRTSSNIPHRPAEQGGNRLMEPP